MFESKSASLFLLVLIFTSLSSQSKAATLPPGNVTAEVIVGLDGSYTTYTPPSFIGPIISASFSSLGESASSTLKIVGWGSSTSLSQLASNTSYTTLPDSSITYYMEVKSATNTMVAVDFSGAISVLTDPNSGGFGRAIFSVTDPTGAPFALYELCLGGCGPSTIPNSPTYQYIWSGVAAKKSIKMVGMLPTNQVITVYLETALNYGRIQNASVKLSKVAIDKSVVNPGQYSIVKGKL